MEGHEMSNSTLITSSLIWTALFGFALGCEQQFKGTGGARPAQQNEEVSPEETEGLAEQPVPAGPTTEVCTGSHKAARLYFVVDNSNSHGYVIPGQAEREGTDPARVTTTVRGRDEARTYRQEALYTIVKRTIELDRGAKETNPEFLGTSLGISYFPKYQGDGNPANTYPGELADLSQYVAVTGASGTGASVFPETLTDLSTLNLTPELDDALWNSFAFTHNAGGSTPYATGLQAAVDQFTSAARPEGDARESFVLFLTDGLPTDETPSRVRELRNQMGTDTKLIIISVYDPNEDPQLTNSPLYRNLKAAFLGAVSWATKPGNPDVFPKTEAGFDTYWNQLIALPGEISDQTVRVPDAAQLQQEIDKILQVVQNCTTQ